MVSSIAFPSAVPEILTFTESNSPAAELATLSNVELASSGIPALLPELNKSPTPLNKLFISLFITSLHNGKLAIIGASPLVYPDIL